MQSPASHIDVDATPFQRLALANQQAWEAAKEPALRSIALDALRGVRNVPRDGPRRLARWVRKNIRYAREAPGVELLQGPFSTLSYRVGDCDDLAILWAALGRSVGLELVVTGVAYKDDPEVLVHAVGEDVATGRKFELSKDVRWGGAAIQPVRFTRPAECYTLTWSPVDEAYHITSGDGEDTMVRRFPNPDKNLEFGDNRQDTPGVDWGAFGQDLLGGVSEGVGSFLSDPRGYIKGDSDTVVYADPYAQQEQAIEPEPRVSPILIGAGIAAAAGLAYLLVKR